MFLLSVVAPLVELICACSWALQNGFCFVLVFLQCGQLVLNIYFGLDLITPFELPKRWNKCYTIHSLMADICFVSKCKEDEWQDFQTQQKAWVRMGIFLSVYPNKF